MLRVLARAMSTKAAAPAEIIEFWFGSTSLTDRDIVVPEEKIGQWWAGGAAFDSICTEKFRGEVDLALADELADWRTKDKEHCLAWVLLCDQFTRNIYRGSSKAFSGDVRARETAKYGLSQNWHKEFHVFAAQFLAMPLMHSEDLSDHDLFTSTMKELEAINPGRDEFFKRTNGAEADHRAVVARFGRYPTRNKALGRETTKEEEEYMQNAESWGQ